MQVGLSKREAGLIWALLGRGEGQTHMTTLIILRWQVGTSRCWAWKWAWKQLNPVKTNFQKNNLDDWWFEYKFLCRVSFFPPGPPRQGGMIFSAVTGWLVDLGKQWPKRATNLKKTGVINWKKVVPLKEVPSCDTGPSSAGGSANTHDNSDFFSSDRLEPPATWFGGEKVAKKGRKSGKNARMIIWKQKVVPLRERGSILWHWALLGRERPNTHDNFSRLEPPASWFLPTWFLPLSHLYQTVQKQTAELTPRWPVVGGTVSHAWGQRGVITQYDSKGDGLKRSVGHVPVKGWAVLDGRPLILLQQWQVGTSC